MTHSLEAGALFFAGLAAALEHENKKALEESAKLVRDTAQHAIGTYELGWPPLEPETIAHKAGGDTPLLETGELRDSIEYTVHEHEHVAYVGTNDPKAKFQELGTVNIPPRSFLRGAAVRKEHEVKEICGRQLFASLVTKHNK